MFKCDVYSDSHVSDAFPRSVQCVSASKNRWMCEVSVQAYEA